MAEATPAQVQRRPPALADRARSIALRVVPGERERLSGSGVGPQRRRIGAARVSSETPRRRRCRRRRWRQRDVQAASVADSPRARPDRQCRFPDGRAGDLVQRHSRRLRAARDRAGGAGVAAFDAGFSSDPRRLGSLQSLMAGLLDEGTATRNADPDRRGAGAARRAASAPAPRLDRTSVDPRGAHAPISLRRSICWRISFAIRPSRRARSTGCAASARRRSRPSRPSRWQSRCGRCRPCFMAPPSLWRAVHRFRHRRGGAGDHACRHRRRPSDAGSGPTIWRSSSSATRPWPTSCRCSSGASAAGGRRRCRAGPRPSPWSRRPPARASSSIDRPQSPQSLILGGRPAARRGDRRPARCSAGDRSPRRRAVGAPLSGSARGARGWSYGAFAFVNHVEHQVPLMFYAPVQTNRTGESVAAMQRSCSRLARRTRRRHRRRSSTRIVSTNIRRPARQLRDLGGGARRHGGQRALPPPGRLSGNARRPLSGDDHGPAQ